MRLALLDITATTYVLQSCTLKKYILAPQTVSAMSCDVAI